MQISQTNGCVYSTLFEAFLATAPVTLRMSYIGALLMDIVQKTAPYN